ncbi:MAG: glycosyltransferase, partial [Prevotella sp.]|nr:glycosyltransferase [Prevotella sp.]
LGTDSECQVLPVSDIPQTPSRLFHYSYKEKVLKPYIESADIVHVNGYTAQGTIDAMRLARRMGKKVVYTGHWHPFRCLRHPFLGKVFFYLKMKRAIEKYANVVTTINNEDTRFFKKIHPHVVQIPHWNEFREVQHHAVERNPKMILFVGRIDDPVKGLGQLYALPEGTYEICCVGRGEIPIQRKDIVQFVDIPTHDLLNLYRKAALLVIPSKYEAFSFVALEALVQGTPVLMSDRVRIADYLEGVDGYAVYRYGDSEDFTEKVARQIGASVDVENIRRIFDSKIIAEKYKKLYLSLV